MVNCYACGEPLTAGSVPLERKHGETVHVCGHCFLGAYPGKTFVDDKGNDGDDDDDDGNGYKVTQTLH